MALREYVATQNLEQLLGNRHEIGEYVLEKVKKEERKYGIELLDSGIKDIISSDSTSGIINVNEIRAEQNMRIIEEKPQMEKVEEIIEEIKPEVEEEKEKLKPYDLLPSIEKLLKEKKAAQVAEVTEEEKYIDKIAEKVAEKIGKSENSNILEELSRILSK